MNGNGKVFYGNVEFQENVKSVLIQNFFFNGYISIRTNYFLSERIIITETFDPVISFTLEMIKIQWLTFFITTSTFDGVQACKEF